jgi:hypothetical protein
MMIKTYWNFEPAHADRGSAVVADAPQFAQYWARAMVGERIDVVRVRYYGQIFWLDNRAIDTDPFSHGWHKVTEGLGGPTWPHRNLSVDPGSWRPNK